MGFGPFFFWSKLVLPSDRYSNEAPQSLLAELGQSEAFSWSELRGQHCLADEFDLDSYEYQQQLFEESYL